MATTQAAPRAGEVKLEYGVAQVVAFKFLQAKAFEGTFGTRALFTLADDRRMWLDAEDGSEIEQSLRALGVQRGELVKLTKIRHPRGGGHSVRVERVAESYSAPADPGDDTEAKLAASVAIARRDGPAAFQRNAHVLPAAVSTSPEVQSAAAGNRDNNNHDNPVTARLMSCYMASIDAITEAQAFADRRGLKVTFTSEDVRATAISAYIQYEKAMTGARY